MAAFHASTAHQHPRQTPLAAAPEEAIGRKAVYVTGLFTLTPHRWLRDTWSAGWCVSGPIGDEAAVLVDFLDEVTRLPAFRRVGRLRIAPYWTGKDASEIQGLLAARGGQPSGADTFSETGWIDHARSFEAIFASFATRGHSAPATGRFRGPPVPGSPEQAARAARHGANPRGTFSR